jgi:hypothetical protein
MNNISNDVKIYLCSYLCNNDKLFFLLTSKYNNNLKNIYFNELIYQYKKYNGGLRLGEMESDAYVDHGMSKIINEHKIGNFNSYCSYVCNTCNLFAIKIDDMYYCQNCNNCNNIVTINIPYSFKIFLQELESMSIKFKIIMTKNISES